MSKNRKQNKQKSAGRPLRRAGLALAGAFALGYGFNLAQEPDFIPLPEDVLPEAKNTNPITALTEKAITHFPSTFSPSLPESFVIHNDNGHVNYNSENRFITYTGGENSPLILNTAEGQEVHAHEISASFEEKVATLDGPIIIYQGESLTHAKSGTYDWEAGEANVTEVRAKVNGLLVRGSHLEYKKDDQGRTYVLIHDAYVSTEDVEKPGMWLGAGTLTVYPGDHGVIRRLSLATDEHDMAFPVLGWVPISHSLNPREGYLPYPGAKSIWGSFLLNRYGVLLGNRRVERGMPVADYVATGRLDWRSRRGYAGGVEVENYHMHRTYRDTTGLSIYYAYDRQPEITPTRRKREPINHDRYRVALQAIWELPEFKNPKSDARWYLSANTTTVSDQYMLRDFFEDISRVDDKPDNAVWLTRRTDRDQAMLLTRFTTNTFYSTDRRTELSYYRVRTPISNSRIYYETRSSAGIFNQFITSEQRVLYQQRINSLRYAEMRDYYTRLLNTNNYFRVNTTHEISTSLNIFRFLNVTPKAGGGYSGYYDVAGVGSDNRLMGYMGVDFDIKFHRHFSGVRLPSMGVYGLYHVFHPYATLSHGSISSSNPFVPQVDTWSNRLGNSTLNPMPLDLMSFTGLDSWCTWTVWRLGTRNTLSTVYDGSSRTLVDWDLFLDYNITNPNTESIFSNLFSMITLYPCRQLKITFESQTPTIRNGDGFRQYNTSVSVMPMRWLEATIGHRYLEDHPVRGDSSQAWLRTNLRFNERYTASSYISWDTEQDRIPIQQYSLFRKFGPWYVGSTFFMRNNGGKKEKGFGLSFTFGETGTALPINLF